MPNRSRLDLLQGTLDLLILRTLQSRGALHGWAISERIRQVSDDVLQANQGSLYPALHRLEHQGLDQGGVGSFGVRPARPLLPVNEFRAKAAAEGSQNWTRLAAAIGKVLEMA